MSQQVEFSSPSKTPSYMALFPPSRDLGIEESRQSRLLGGYEGKRALLELEMEFVLREATLE